MRKLFYLLLFCLLALSAFSQEEKLIKFHPKVKFSDFKVNIYNGPKAKIKIVHYQHRRYRTMIRQGYKTRCVNFAGHYCFIEWGCGSPCRQSAIVDVITGQVYDAPGSAEGYEFKKNSRLLISDPPFRGPDSKYYDKNIPYEKPGIYVFNDSTKKFKEIRY